MQLDENRAIRGLRIGKKKIKLSVLVDDMIIYILKISESKRKLLYVITLFSLKKNTLESTGYQKLHTFICSNTNQS